MHEHFQEVKKEATLIVAWENKWDGIFRILSVQY